MRSSPHRRAALGAFLIGLAVLVAALIWGIALYPQLPDRVPVHWDAAGNANRYAEKSVWSVLGLPIIGILVAVLLFAIAATADRFPRQNAAGVANAAQTPNSTGAAVCSM